jgi:membrane-associated protease RseP (regulator of RpoE activity)
MKQIWIIGIPLTFVAGIASAVVLQSFGLIRIVPNDAKAVSVLAPGSAPSTTPSTTQSSPNQNDPNSTSKAALELTALREQINQLQDEVRAATRQRDVMRAELIALQEQRSAGIEGEAFLPQGDSGNSTQLGEAVATRRGGTQDRFRNFGGPSSEQQYEALVGSGVDQQVAAEIKQRTDQWELSRLDLIDKATREGWRRSDEFGDAMRDLRDQRVDIRAELGDDAYDRYLFSSGDNNRVRIDSIIDGSAAQLAGMESGDLVLSYANTRIFTGQELQRATREGARGEYVSVYVQRSSQYLELSIPRGPLGVQLVGARQEP